MKAHNSKPSFPDALVNKFKDSHNTLVGHIDGYEYGFLRGWAIDVADPDRRLSVGVLCDGEPVGQGTASEYRGDLKQVGIGEGDYSFHIKIQPAATDGFTHKITLADHATGSPINAPPFSVSVGVKAKIFLTNIEWGNLRGHLEATNTGEQVNVGLLMDGYFTGQTVLANKDAQGRYAFSLNIPPSFMDGLPHVLTAVIKELPGVEANYVDVLSHIYTPWEHIAKSANDYGYPGLSKMAAHRYDSLKAWLEHFERAEESHQQDAAKRLSNIALAHRVVVEGYEARRKYPVLTLDPAPKPQVTVVIPAHNQFALTYHCVASLISSYNKASFEVILVDDVSNDETTEAEAYFQNIRVIRNKRNQGFLKNCNLAASAAKGKYILLLNNDTEVTSGWLDELLDVFQRFDNVGMAGSKLIYPDGKLQEAGGIVWANGEPWNLGNRENARAPTYNYARQVDYLSGAAIMISAEVWTAVGGFSEEFAPAYYEDTDLAFKVREAGYKTVYVPQSEVVHFEGMSNGRDLSSGIKKYQNVNAPKFRAKWVDAYKHNGIIGQNLLLNRDRNVAYRVLMIDYAVPRPDQDAGSYAAVQEIRMLQANGCKIVFVAENLAHMGSYTDALQKMGVECVHAPFHTSISQFLIERGSEFDLAYITRYDVAERHIESVRKYTNAKVIFNNADLHFLRELRAALASRNADLSGPLATRERELALMRRVDLILTYSATEQAVVMSHNLRVDNMHICPWVLKTTEHTPGRKDRSDIAFLGGYRHAPNVEAVEYFVRDVMPHLRQLVPGIAFRVYGSSVPDRLYALAADDVIIEGYVEDLHEVFDSCAVFVAPLQSGAGIKGKVLEAMAHGTPSVLSSIAAEGTGLTHGVNAYVVDSAWDWAEHIADLYSNTDRWELFSSNSKALAANNYSFSNGVKSMRDALEKLGIYAPRHPKSLFPR